MRDMGCAKSQDPGVGSVGCTLAAYLSNLGALSDAHVGLRYHACSLVSLSSLSTWHLSAQLPRVPLHDAWAVWWACGGPRRSLQGRM